MRETRNRPELKRSEPVELKFAGAGEGVITGYGSVFGHKDAHGDTVVQGAFSASLAAHKAAGTMPAMLWQHDGAEPIGVWEEVTEDARGLRVKGRLNLETTRGREALSLLKQGALNGLSIGFLVPDGGAKLDRHTGERTVTEIDLWEVSLVTFPSNGKARLLSVRDIESRAAFESFLKEHGFARAAAKALAAGGWPALTSPDPAAEQLLAELKAATAALKGNSK
jgi:uncharacterized protein